MKTISEEMKQKLCEVIEEELRRFLDNDHEAWFMAEVILNRVWDPIIDDVVRRTVFEHNQPGGDVETSGRVTQLDKNTIQIVGVSQGPPSRRKQMQFELLKSIDEALKDFAEQHLKDLKG